MASETKRSERGSTRGATGNGRPPGFEADPPHGASRCWQTTEAQDTTRPPVPTGLLTRVIIPENWAPSRSRETNENL